LKSKLEQKQKLSKQSEEILAKVFDKTETITKIIKEKAERTKNASFPIDGLGFNNGDVSFEGVEFSQISMAQKIKVSMSMAIALNPKMKIVRILNGSLLDDDSMKEIEAIAEEKDYQIWIERVADSKSGNAIYIEDGQAV